MSDSPSLILVDGSSYLFRAFHALPPLVNSKRQPTGAVKGVINMIRSLIQSYPDSQITIVFDAKGKTFRSDIYQDYKAHRPPMPDELRSQIKPIHEIIMAMGLPLISVPGVEADDVIGTLAAQATDKNRSTLISTGDKDLAQLVNEHVTLMNTMTNEFLDAQGVVTKFGIAPNQIIDYLALVGDKADNIPGVPSVGPKTAVKWLLEYESAEGVIANAESVGGKVGEKLRDNFEQLRLSYELATIKLDCELTEGIDELVATKPDKQKLMDLYVELEFKSWIKELEQEGISARTKTHGKADLLEEDSAAGTDPTSNVINVTPDSIDYQLIDNYEQLDELIDQLSKCPEFALHMQLPPGHFLEPHPQGIALSTELGKVSFIPLRSVTSAGAMPKGVETTDEQSQLESASALDCQTVLMKLKPLLENAEIRKAAYDLKSLAHTLAAFEINLAPFKADVLLASYVLNSVASKHKLSDIAAGYIDFTLTDINELLGKGKNKLSFAQLKLEQQCQIVSEKADAVLRLSRYLEHQLKIHGHLDGVYRYYELALIPALRTIEQNGICVDTKLLQQQSIELGQKLAELEQEAYAIAGEEFNLGSPKQLQSIFYEKLELPVLKKTKTGQPSTAEPILQELAEEHDLPRIILQQRSLSKLKSTYTDKLPLDVQESTGRIHSSFQQAVAATGRLSSMEPNLQNIPIRSAEGRRVRQAFIPAPGYQLVAADYSQVELRIMAHLSQDSGLLTAFTSAEDVHRATAADVFSVDLEDVSPDQRRSAKAINFGLIYGMSAFGLANQLNIGRSEAQEYVDRYFQKYPGVRVYMDETQALADEKGYVETLYGRRLYLPDIHAGKGMLRKAAQRTAINAPMQGTAADIIKRAMIEIAHWLEMGELDARMLLQVHDELVFEVSEKDLELLCDGVRFRMVTAASMDVPLVVDIGVGSNWDEAH